MTALSGHRVTQPRRGYDVYPTLTVPAVWAALGGVDDPEYPGISIVELGLVEAVRVDAAGGRIEVDLIPTFSGCPALDFIADDVRAALGGLDPAAEVVVSFLAAPAWSPARIAPSARPRLAGEFGVGVQLGDRPPPCPRCGTGALLLDSLFGPTRCRSVHRCRSCGEIVELIR